MESLARIIRDFFAQPDLLTSSGAPVSATHASRGSPSTAVGHSPSIVSGSGATSSAANGNTSSSSISTSSRLTVSLLIPQSFVRFWNWLRHHTLLGNPHAKKLLVIVAFLVAARVVQRLLTKLRVGRPTVRAPGIPCRSTPLRSSAAVSASPKRVFHIQSLHDDPTLFARSGILLTDSNAVMRMQAASDEAHAGNRATPTHLRTPGALSDVSSVRGTPQVDLVRQMAPGSDETVARDEHGKMFVLHRNGAYIEVWEADEYGQVRDASLSYGDPDERCEELLDHFKREASLMLDHQHGGRRSPSGSPPSSCLDVHVASA